jgi:hypothetical protein
MIVQCLDFKSIKLLLLLLLYNKYLTSQCNLTALVEPVAEQDKTLYQRT